jgi:hypothetical protein
MSEEPYERLTSVEVIAATQRTGRVGLATSERERGLRTDIRVTMVCEAAGECSTGSSTSESR